MTERTERGFHRFLTRRNGATEKFLLKGKLRFSVPPFLRVKKMLGMRISGPSVSSFSMLAGPHPHSLALRRSKTRYPRAGRRRYLYGVATNPRRARTV